MENEITEREFETLWRARTPGDGTIPIPVGRVAVCGRCGVVLPAGTPVYLYTMGIEHASCAGWAVAPNPYGEQLWEPCEKCGGEPSYARANGHLCAACIDASEDRPRIPGPAVPTYPVEPDGAR